MTTDTLDAGPRADAPPSRRRLGGFVAAGICLLLWVRFGLPQKPDLGNQTNRPLFDAAARVLRAIPTGESATIWIVAQDEEPANLAWRRLAYVCVPHRTPMLPFRVRTPSPEYRGPFNPTSGGYAALGAETAFATPESLDRYLAPFGVTHVMVRAADAELSRLFALPLPAGHVLLLRRTPEGGFEELARAPLD